MFFSKPFLSKNHKAYSLSQLFISNRFLCLPLKVCLPSLPMNISGFNSRLFMNSFGLKFTNLNEKM